MLTHLIALSFKGPFCASLLPSCAGVHGSDLDVSFLHPEQLVFSPQGHMIRSSDVLQGLAASMWQQRVCQTIPQQPLPDASVSRYSLQGPCCCLQAQQIRFAGVQGTLRQVQPAEKLESTE